MGESISFVEADDELWQEYERLAARSFGHRVEDITLLRDRVDVRVGLRGGKVVAGGLGLLVPQHFGGSPVPSACLSAGCIAPEERGERLGYRQVTERVRALQERGAVISTVWTSSNAYARHMGWEAVVPVFAWAIASDDLKRSFSSEDFEIEHGLTAEARQVQCKLAGQWNGSVRRPEWWSEWKTEKSGLAWYRFGTAGQTAGVLSFAASKRQPRGMNLVVHDFWAADETVASAMMAFLGRHNSRAQTVQFRRGALPPYPLLLHNLHRHRATAEAWHPWMLRILDIRGAVRLRGWPADIDVTVPIEIESENGDAWDRYVLRLADGSAEIESTSAEGKVSLTRRQFAVWYAGGYRTAAAARLSGVRVRSEEALTSLIRSTADLEPWLPDHF
jgi:predicted acetyltransferase